VALPPLPLVAVPPLPLVALPPAPPALSPLATPVPLEAQPPLPLVELVPPPPLEMLPTVVEVHPLLSWAQPVYGTSVSAPAMRSPPVASTAANLALIDVERMKILSAGSAAQALRRASEAGITSYW
jgi:hypothetical protein